VELSYTVLVISDDQDGQRIHELATTWHADGLLHDFAIVTPASVDRTGQGPPLIHARPVGESADVELMRLLGNRRRDLIRVVVLHALTHKNISATAMVEVCNQVSTMVKRAMPVGAAGDHAVKLLRINMLVPETDVVPQQTALLQPGWEVNAVVSPEDRPDVDRLSVFIRAEENLHGHALAAAATIGGLWRGMHAAALDDARLDSTSADRDSVVVRCQVRLILGDDRSDRLAHAAIDAVIGTADGAVRHLEWGFVSDRPDQLVDRCLTQLMSTPEWRPDSRTVPVLARKEQSLGTLIGDWLRFQASLPLAAFKFFGASAQDAAERGLTYTFVGSDVGVLGRLDPEAPRVTQAHATARLTALSDALEPTRLAQDAAVSGQATPTAWRTLRELCLGLVDGSELPPGFDRLRRAELDEVLPPSFIAPSQGREVVNGQEFRGVDVEAVARMGEPTGSQSIADSKSPSDETPELGDTEREASVGPEADHSPNSEAKAPDVTQEIADDATPQAEGGASASSAPSPAVEARTDHSMRSWVDDRRHTLLWKLSKRVYEQRRSEQRKATDANKTIDANREAPAADSLVRARRVLLITWTVSLVLIVTGVISYLYAPGPVEEWLTRQRWQSIATWIAVILAIFLFGGHHYYRASRNYEWAVQQRLHNLRAASDEYVAATQQETRWSLMYAGVLDWADILSELLHRPWTDPETYQGVPDAPGGLPAAVAMAQPAGQSTEPTIDMIAEAVEAVCHRGWLREEFDRATTRSRLNDSSTNLSIGDLPADLDLGLRRNGARGDLLDVVMADHGRMTAGREVYEQIQNLVAVGDVRVPSLNVQRIGDYANGEVRDDRDFIASIVEDPGSFSTDVFSSQALVHSRHVVQDRVLTIPHGVECPPAPGLKARTSEPSISTRVDVSGTLTPSDLSLFVPKEHVAGPKRQGQAGDFN
jgi:hypothetical protein